MILLSNWGSIQLTDASRALAASGATIKFTKIKLGSGTLANVNTATDLARPKQLVPLTGLNVSNGVAALTGLLTTDKVNNSFMASEAGVFASDNNGGEILFLVCNDSSPDLIPDKTNPVPSSISYTFNIAANSATADLDNSSLVVLSLLNRHKIDPNAHGAMTSTADDDATPTIDTNDLRTLLSNLAARLKATAGTADWKLTASDLETLNTAVTAINIDQTRVPVNNTGTLQVLLSEMANRVKTLTGYSDWKNDTVKSLKDVAKWFSDLKKLNTFMQICSIASPAQTTFNIIYPTVVCSPRVNLMCPFSFGPGFLYFTAVPMRLVEDFYFSIHSTTLPGLPNISSNPLLGYEYTEPIAGLMQGFADSGDNGYTMSLYTNCLYINDHFEYWYTYGSGYTGWRRPILQGACMVFLNGFGGLLDD